MNMVVLPFILTINNINKYPEILCLEGQKNSANVVRFSERNRWKERTRAPVVNQEMKRETFLASGLALNFKPTKCQKAMEWKGKKGKNIGTDKMCFMSQLRERPSNTKARP